jgi:hypothetical protein
MYASIIPYINESQVYTMYSPDPNTLTVFIEESYGIFYRFTSNYDIQTYIPEYDLNECEINSNHIISESYCLFGFYSIEKIIGTFYLFKNGNHKLFIPKIIF